MKVIRNTLPLLFLFCFSAAFAHAQAGLDAYFGMGTATNSSSNALIDTFNTGNFFTTPKMGGAFGKAGATLMFTPHFGVGGEADFRFSQGAYAGLTYRPTFYDFNGIFMPFRGRVTPEFQAGIGGVNLKFYYPQSFCDVFAGCSTSNIYLESSNHFQQHMAAGVRFYVTRHVFIRPEIEARHVDNFFQFGSNWVPEYSASIGYNFGEH